MKKFYICCRRGCPRRSLDTQRIYDYFIANDWVQTHKPGNANLIIIYTCGGFETSENRSLNTIQKMVKNKKEDAKIIVTGCLLKINKPSIQCNDSVFVEHKNLHELDLIINAQKPYDTIPDPNFVFAPHDLVSEPIAAKIKDNLLSINKNFFDRSINYLKSLKHRKSQFDEKIYNIKIAHGCISNCSYCVIRKATGPLHSKSKENIINEFRRGLSSGHKKFVLIAEDVGCYGIDINTTIVSLLSEMLNEKGEFSIIVNDFNARWLIKYYDVLLPLFKTHYKKIHDIRIPIQSGSNRILELMRRGYRIEDVKQCLVNLHREIPNLKIGTHVIVGFPSEEDEDFAQTQQLVRDINFSTVSVYRYENRPMTAASKLPNQLPEAIINKRAWIINAM